MLQLRDPGLGRIGVGALVKASVICGEIGSAFATMDIGLSGMRTWSTPPKNSQAGGWRRLWNIVGSFAG